MQQFQQSCCHFWKFRDTSGTGLPHSGWETLPYGRGGQTPTLRACGNILAEEVFIITANALLSVCPRIIAYFYSKLNLIMVLEQGTRNYGTER